MRIRTDHERSRADMKVQRSAILPYSSEQMYAVINDVRSYPEFLNWCSAATVHRESSSTQVAELTIAYRKLAFSFSTENTLTQNENIQMQLVAGPFKDLSGHWALQSLGDSACKVSLQMGFTFDNPITHRLFAKVFQSVVSAQVDAFQKRAEHVYGA